MITNQQLLEKVKNEFSIDFNDKDSTLLALIVGVKSIAQERTGIDFEIEEMPEGVELSIVDNVGTMFDNKDAKVDQTVFHMFNKRAML